ncbi:heterokaryon incompatibility protein-domain-containing protein [Leptodontidium sp. MPI-SDFR-AT-0119]|nr:heterokaryon incompatibility protein-domain-containing protein [Leptodontidium sp. MPI-SDFR-AT-0119]
MHQTIDSNHEIRILRIQHGKDGDPLECMLFPSALELGNNQKSHSEHQKWPYTALSYWWGDPDEVAGNRITIYKDTGARGVRQTLTGFNQSGTFFIRDNLNAALLRFRHATEDVNVWVDAICINQDDKTEKSSQVARMHEVYTQAESVCVWLGEGNDDTELTFEFLKRILDLQALDDLVANPEETAESWALVLQLITNHWFSRRWVIQELALARKAYVRCGSMDLSWKDFADSIALFMTKYEEIRRSILDHASLVCRDPESIILKTTDARALGANVVVHATVNLFRKSHEGRIEQRLLPLEILVSSLLVAFETTEPRDTIFAVLTLANDSELSSSNPSATRDARISPDYEKCLLDVYADFIDYCIQQSQSLDILCRYWAAVQKQSKAEALKKGTSEVDTLPSWIPLIRHSAFGEPRYIVEGGANEDGFVGCPERKGQQIYNASAGSRAWHKFGVHDLKEGKLREGFTFRMNKHSRPSTSTGHSRPAALIAPKSEPNTLAEDSALKEETSSRMPKYNGSLFLRGFCLDIISQVSSRVGGGIIPSEALEMAGWGPKYKPQTVPDKLWRTLVADRGPDGKNAPPWYTRACWECLQYQDRRGDLDIPELMENLKNPSTRITFLKRVQSIVWKRRFFETKGASHKSLFGLGSPAIKNGDLVCILFGCSVPVVLRKDHERKYYQIIGECYVYGMMDGEAIAGKAPAWPYDQLEYSTFELR